jgi:hypothetical protein
MRDGLKGGRNGGESEAYQVRPLWRAGDGDTGERGPASIYCDLCRDEVKREQAAQRAYAYRQRRRLLG